jgi:hypothetical protein
MNCSDILRVLDERDIASLAMADEAEFRIHVAACRDCASQVLASEGVAAFRVDVPSLPAGLHECASQLQSRLETQSGRRPSRRPVLIGSLLLLGAAATMFAVVPGPDDRATT